MMVSGLGMPSASASTVKLPVLLPMITSGSAAWMRAKSSIFSSRTSRMVSTT